MSTPDPPIGSGPVKLLTIGGTRFSGRAFTGMALDHGHEVTVFHRGTGDDPWPDAEHIHADRADGFDALAGRSFDAAVDFCGYVPRELRASTVAFGDAGRYVFVSSLSAHRDDVRPGATEDDDVHEPPFPDSEKITDESYGPLKVASERVVVDAFGDRATIVRPGLIVGPYDPTDRFTYWVRRVAAGGRVLAPGPRDYEVQWIDARDLAAFVLLLVERSTRGTYSVVGPPLPIERLLTACRDVSGSGADLVWVSRSFLEEHGVEPWEELPLWIPQYPGFNLFDARKAVAAGLTTRRVEETVSDTLRWDRERGEQPQPMEAGLAPEREAELLADWPAEP
jgi:2'-hydroxyisoflavone reductase